MSSSAKETFGFAACAALNVWMFLVIDSHAIYNDSAAASFLAPYTIAGCVAARLLVDAIVGFASKGARRLSSYTVVVQGCPLVLVVGTVLVACAANGWLGGIPLLVLGAILCGLGMETMLLLWLELFSGFGFAVVKKLLLWMIGMQALASALCFAPSGYAFVISLLLPFASIGGYYACRAKSKVPGTTRLRNWRKPPISKTLLIGAGVALLYFGFHFLQFGFQDTLANTAGSYDVGRIANLLGRWIAFAVVYLVLKNMRDFRFGTMFRTATIVGICAFLILPLQLGESGFLIFCTMTVVACFLTEYAVTLSTVSIAGRSAIEPARLIAWGRISINVGAVIGVGGGVFLATILADNPDRFLPMIAAGSVLMIAIAGIWFLREQAIDDFLWDGTAQPSSEREGRAKTVRISSSASRMADEYSLTIREAEVLTLVLEGRSIPCAAKDLYISSNTVKTHVRHIYEKTGVRNKQDLFALSQIGKGA